MCDYSLEHYRTTPAQQGETYETNRFPSGSIGFVVPGDQSVAVCMTYDTGIKLTNIPVALQTRLGVSPEERVTFARIESGTYRDGIRFANGRTITLQELGTGVKAVVHDALVTPLPEFEPKKTVRQTPELVS
jgi:hypothetical protein